MDVAYARRQRSYDRDRAAANATGTLTVVTVFSTYREAGSLGHALHRREAAAGCRASTLRCVLARSCATAAQLSFAACAACSRCVPMVCEDFGREVQRYALAERESMRAPPTRADISQKRPRQNINEQRPNSTALEHQQQRQRASRQKISSMPASTRSNA